LHFPLQSKTNRLLTSSVRRCLGLCSIHTFLRTAMASRKTHRSPSEDTHRAASSLNSTVIFPLFSHAYHSRSRSRPASAARRPVSASPTKQSTVSRLRGRQGRPKNSEVTPALAAQVVKDYLIPLFEADVRQSADKQREVQFGKDSVRYWREDSYHSSESTK